MDELGDKSEYGPLLDGRQQEHYAPDAAATVGAA
jgi:hypothetical protein